MRFIKCGNKKCGSPIAFEYSDFENGPGEYKRKCPRCSEITVVNLEYEPNLDVDDTSESSALACFMRYEFRSTRDVAYAMECLVHCYKMGDIYIGNYFDNYDWLAICQRHFLTGDGDLK